MDPTVAGVQVAGGLFLLLFLCGIAWTVIMFICWGKIGKKCGFSFWWTAILMFLPIVNVIMLLVLGYSKRPPLELADPKPEKLQKELDDLKDRVTRKELDDLKDRLAKSGVTQKDLDDLKAQLAKSGVTRKELDDLEARVAKLEAEKKEDPGEKIWPDDSGKTGPEFCGEEEKSGGF